MGKETILGFHAVNELMIIIPRYFYLNIFKK